MMDGYGYAGGSGWWMVVIQVVVLALVVAGITYAAVIGARHLHTTPTATGDQAQAILQERFARGEIDDQEFQRRSGRLSRP